MLYTMSFIAMQAAAQDSVSMAQMIGLPAHPRLLLKADEEKNIRTQLQVSPVWQNVQQTILTESERLLTQPPVERIQIGRRLLDKSRTCLQRTFFLSYAYRMSGDKRYAERAKLELLQVCGFSDWNPSHFLDVAEMTLAVALGYDWLFDLLDDSERQWIKKALVEKGILPSFDPAYNWFLTSNHNWNQVCNAGMVFGALAIAEDDPELALKVVNRAIRTVKLAMKAYGPDGAYPEGYAYWDYGTSFNVLLINCLEKAFSSDFALTSIPGFLNTAYFLENMTGPTGTCFNWGDSKLTANLNPAMFWFAQKQSDPSLLWVEKEFLEAELYKSMSQDRLLPALILWGSATNMGAIQPPDNLCWRGQGENPVCLMRTSWTDPQALYVGFKAGSPQVNHAHMDVGSFVVEANGVRWASDLGMQDYESLESKGIALWGQTQDAQRWTIKRLNNYVHNTWTFSGSLQRVDGYAKIERYSGNPDRLFAIADLSSLYSDQVQSVWRGIAIRSRSNVLVRDEIQNKEQVTVMRWTMLTSCNVDLTQSGPELEIEGKKLRLIGRGPIPITWQTWSTEPTTDYDADNTGTVLVGFEYEARPGEKVSFQVLFVPEGTQGDFEDFPLSAWR